MLAEIKKASKGDADSSKKVFEYLCTLEQKEEHKLSKIRLGIKQFVKNFEQKSSGIAVFRAVNRKGTLGVLKLFRALDAGSEDAVKELDDYIHALDASIHRLDDMIRNFHQEFDALSFVLRYPDNTNKRIS